MVNFGEIPKETVMSNLFPKLQPIKNIVDDILQELGSVTIYMSYFDAEREHENGCIYLYKDDVLGSVFGPIQQSIYESTLMGLARLCDNANVCGHDTLGFNQLMQSCKNHIDELQQSADRFNGFGDISVKLNEFQMRFNNLSTVIDSIKVQRNKLYAHNEMNVSLDLINQNNGLSLQNLKDVYNLIFDFVNYINGCMINTWIPKIEHPDVFGYMFDKLPEAMQLLFEKYNIERK